MPDGTPSHDTFSRVLSALNHPEELEKCFMEWTRSVADLCKHEAITIDCVAAVKEPDLLRRTVPC